MTDLVKRLREYVIRCPGSWLRDAADEIERLESECLRLRDAIRDFGEHNPICKHRGPYTCIEMRPDCDCGFNEILEPSVNENSGDD